MARHFSYDSNQTLTKFRPHSSTYATFVNVCSNSLKKLMSGVRHGIDLKDDELQNVFLPNFAAKMTILTCFVCTHSNF